MSIYTDPQGDARASTIIVGLLYGATALLALYAWNRHPSLTPWAFIAGAVAVFASVCAAPGWIAAFWYAYVRKLPDWEIEEKRHTVNVVTAWIAVMATIVGAGYAFRSRDAWSQWTARDVLVAVAIFAGYMFAHYAIEKITALKLRSDQLEVRMQQLEAAIQVLAQHRTFRETRDYDPQD